MAGEKKGPAVVPEDQIGMRPKAKYLLSNDFINESRQSWNSKAGFPPIVSPGDLQDIIP